MTDCAEYADGYDWTAVDIYNGLTGSVHIPCTDGSKGFVDCSEQARQSQVQQCITQYPPMEMQNQGRARSIRTSARRSTGSPPNGAGAAA
jgi:hypothetical protein